MAKHPEPKREAFEEIRFTANADFFSDETQSQYVKGLSYTVREGDDALATAHKKWLRDGKISLGGPAAKLSGKG